MLARTLNHSTGIILLAVVVSLIFVFNCKASTLRFYDSNCLSSNLINDIEQDGEGYIWIATQYGLNKFDGIRFTKYFHKDSDATSVGSDNVRFLETDNEGKLWTFTYNTVKWFNSASETFVDYNLEPGFGECLDVTKGKDGNIYLLRRKRIEVVNSEIAGRSIIPLPSGEDNGFEKISIDNDGNLWLSGNGKVAMINLKTSKKEIIKIPELSGENLSKVIQDKAGRLIIASGKRIGHFNRHTGILEDAIILPNTASAPMLVKNNADEIFVGSFGNGLLRVDLDKRLVEKAYEWSDKKPVYDIQKVLAFLEDRDGNIWLGLYQTGIVKINPINTPFRFYDLSRTGCSNDRILRMCFIDHNGELLISQEDNGVIMIARDGSAAKTFLPGVHVLCGAETVDKQHYCFGTFFRGLAVVDKVTGNTRWILKNGWIRSIVEQAPNVIYAGFFGEGVKAYDFDSGKELSQISESIKLLNKQINKLFIDSDGWLWIGNQYGVEIFDTKSKKMVTLPEDNVFNRNEVHAITQGKEGDIWIGARQGLYRYNKQNHQWKKYDTENGLSNEFVCGIVCDDIGDLWISTFNGLNRMLVKEEAFENYFHADGMPHTSYLKGIYSKSPRGEIFFGNEDGLTYFAPQKVNKLDFNDKVYLTGIIAEGKALSPYTPLKFTSESGFTLQFSPMDFRDMDNVYIEYCIDGNTSDRSNWQKLPASQSDIQFTHLSPGKHVLSVRAVENGVFSPVNEYKITITPPWYLSWWAYLCYILVAGTIVWLLIHAYRRRKEAEVNEEKIKFFVDISHELRSPLTLIKGPLDNLLQKETDPVKRRNLNRMSRNADRLLLLVNQILSIRKIEKGQTKLHFAETSISSFVENLCHDYDYEVEKRGISFSYTTYDEDLKVYIDREYFDKVIANLIGNAMKYVANNTGSISVEVGCKDGLCVINVVDNGPGIDEARLQSIFKRFYQASARSSSGRIGYGIGLNLSYKLVSLHGGSISAKNRTDGQSGSIFTVILPLGCSHLNAADLVSDDYYNPIAQESSQNPIATDSIHNTKKRTTFRIAVVDDDEEIRNFLKTELGEYYSVKTYANGRDALAGIVESQPDLVISDVVMPEIDGYTLLHRLKNNTKTSHIPVILLTSKTDHQSRVQGFGKGADAYVDKPFSLEVLEARISSLIDNRIRMKGKFSGTQEQGEVVRPIEIKGNNDQLMEKVMKVINDRLSDENFNVEALGEEVGLSRAQLHRRIKELTGITVGEFIRNQRMQQAARLLEKGDVTIAQVAYAVGLVNPTHFTTAFKKYFGVTPSAYMEKHSNDTNSEVNATN